MYSMLTGVLPFHNRNIQRQNEAIVNNPLEIPNQVRVPHSDAFADLVTKLLAKDPSERLGFNGAHEILAHEWFVDCDLEDFLAKRIVPKVPSDFEEKVRDLTYFN